MANAEESNPLLQKQDSEVNDEKKPKIPVPSSAASSPIPEAVKPSRPLDAVAGWTADGLPFVHGSVVGEPVMRRNQWSSGVFSFLGRNDDFCGSDLEVCLLGSVAPCVLYGSNIERLASSPESFSNHCLRYTGLLMLGNFLFGSNLLAPWFSYPTRTAIRRKFNLEGNCEALSRSCGCCGSILEDEVQLEQYETACDFATHVFCHPCALCQESREVRRRVPHPAHAAQPIVIMIPPGQQTMNQGA